MKTIQILGTGCPKCKLLTERAAEAVAALGMDAEIRKVEDINEILSFGVMMTPALAVDGDVKFVGKIPDESEIKAILENA